MRKLSVFLGVVLATIGSAVSAQEAHSTATMQMSSWGDANECEIIDYIPDVSLDTRFGYSHDFAEGTGRFGGNGLLLDINGRISPHFSYSFNHRLASFEGEDGLGFDNTNWLTLDYEHDYFYISAGKQDIKVGSWEYDMYDLDCYWEMNSQFWNNVSPWQWGISAGAYPADGQTIILQCTNSPYAHKNLFNLFAYSLAWQGEWDCYDSYWSVNMWEYEKGRFVNSLNLGNRFYVGDFTFDLDYSTRCTSLKKAFTEDFTVSFMPAYEWEWGRAFAKVGYEKISACTYVSPLEDIEDAVLEGENWFYGAGVEFFPIKIYKDVRIHAMWASNSFLTEGHYLNVGLTWNLNLTRAAKALFNKIRNK